MTGFGWFSKVLHFSPMDKSTLSMERVREGVVALNPFMHIAAKTTFPFWQYLKYARSIFEEKNEIKISIRTRTKTFLEIFREFIVYFIVIF